MSEKGLIILLSILMIGVFALRASELIETELFGAILSSLVTYLLGLKNVGLKTNDKGVAKFYE